MASEEPAAPQPGPGAFAGEAGPAVPTVRVPKDAPMGEAGGEALSIRLPENATAEAASAGRRGSFRVAEGLGELVLDTSVFHELYTLGNAVGSGSYSVVRLCQHRKSGKIFAVKMIDKSRIAAQRRLRDEIVVLTRVKHPHIMSVLGIFETDTELFLVMEWATGGELFDRIVARGMYSELSARGAISKLLDALRYLHANNIVHRDIKPENILLVSETDDEQVKLSDFGLAKIFEQTDALPDGGDDAVRYRTYTSCGTDLYVAPEVIAGYGYDKAVDIWSIGVVMYILLCGFPPFESLTTGAINWNVEFPDPYWEGVSLEAKDLLRNLLQVDPEARFTAEDAISHPWITGRAATSDSHLSTEYSAEMRRFNAKRKHSEHLTMEQVAEPRPRFS